MDQPPIIPPVDAYVVNIIDTTDIYKNEKRTFVLNESTTFKVSVICVPSCRQVEVGHRVQIDFSDWRKIGIMQATICVYRGSITPGQEVMKMFFGNGGDGDMQSPVLEKLEVDYQATLKAASDATPPPP